MRRRSGNRFLILLAHGSLEKCLTYVCLSACYYYRTMTSFVERRQSVVDYMQSECKELLKKSQRRTYTLVKESLPREAVDLNVLVDSVLFSPRQLDFISTAALDDKAG